MIKIRPATLAELETIVTSIPERYKVLILLAAWCALRFGEITELRRPDVDLDYKILYVRRGVVRVDGEVIVGTPKSEAGIRDVAIPPHLMPLIQTHLDRHAEAGKNGLVFPARNGGHLATGSLAKVYYRAREAAGRPDLRFHHLRHTGAVLAAVSGATLADLMERLGHTTPTAALSYQRTAGNSSRRRYLRWRRSLSYVPRTLPPKSPLPVGYRRKGPLPHCGQVRGRNNRTVPTIDQIKPNSDRRTTAESWLWR